MHLNGYGMEPITLQNSLCYPLDVAEVSTFEDLQAYLAHCQDFLAYSSQHGYAISPKVAAITTATERRVSKDESTLWEEGLWNAYSYGGRVHTLDLRGFSGLRLVRRVTEFAAEYKRPIEKINLGGVCRNATHITICNFPILSSICINLNLSGNKLRDEYLKTILHACHTSNFVQVLNLDSCSVGDGSVAIICEWLRSSTCSLRVLSLRDTGIFSSRPGVRSTHMLGAEQICQAISNGGTIVELILGKIPGKKRILGRANDSFVCSLAKALQALRSNAQYRTLRALVIEDASVQLSPAMTTNMFQLHNLRNLSFVNSQLNDNDINVLCCSLLEILLQFTTTIPTNTSNSISLNLSGNNFYNLQPLFPLLLNNKLHLLICQIIVLTGTHY
jgi:hypothetical protein